MIKNFLPLLFFYFAANQIVVAQKNVDETFLPHYQSPFEHLTPSDLNNSGDMFFPQSPPPKNIRTMAEWEELQALCISWQGSNAILSEIVRAARQECKVIVLVKDATTETNAKNYLTNTAKVDISSNVEFQIIPTNSIWIRDYGGNSAYVNNVDTLVMVDWVYNRPSRKLDDSSPTQVAANLGVTLYRTLQSPNDLVHTGGNFMSDGLGTAFSSDLVYEENAAMNPNNVSTKSKPQVDSILQQYMGINRYVTMKRLPFDGIHHIDMHMKVLDEETLIFSEYPKNTADGPQIEANIQYILSNYKTPYGKPYKVHRVIAPPDATGKYPDTKGDYRTYANMVFVNKTVIVPFYEKKYDTLAEKTLKKALPGYKIVGVNCNSIIPSLGAIHCITKEVGVAEPLWITHEAVTDKPAYGGEKIPIAANVSHRKGIKDVTIWYKNEKDAVFIPLKMSQLDITKNNWQTSFDNLPTGKYNYYIAAEAKNGKKITRPITAPEGFYSFTLAQPTSQTTEVAAVGIKIYPNPARAITCVEVENMASKKLSISLLDIYGRVVTTLFEGVATENLNRYFFDAQNLQTGIYFVKIKSQKEERVQKVVVVR
jgi:agmatine deiminase